MGDPPVPVGDSLTGKARRDAAESRSLLFETRLPFHPASRRAAQASGLYPEANFQTRSNLYISQPDRRVRGPGLQGLVI
jgi:hypothetical protein